MSQHKPVVNKIGEHHYELPCSVCGRTAVVIRMGPGKDVVDRQAAGTLYLLYRGITHEPLPGLAAEHADLVFPYLEAGDLAGLHAYFKEIDVRMEEGIDAYCPECDAIYCWTHFDAYQEFDDGFYDCTMGVCPQSHRRVLDD